MNSVAAKKWPSQPFDKRIYTTEGLQNISQIVVPIAEFLCFVDVTFAKSREGNNPFHCWVEMMIDMKKLHTHSHIHNYK